MQLVSEAVAKLQTEFATDQLEKALPAGIRSSIRTVEVTPAFAKAVVNTSASQLNVQILSDSLRAVCETLLRWLLVSKFRLQRP